MDPKIYEDPNEKRDWIVTLQCTSTITVRCTNCTKADAEAEPWEYAPRFTLEATNADWEVQEVQPA